MSKPFALDLAFWSGSSPLVNSGFWKCQDFIVLSSSPPVPETDRGLGLNVWFRTWCLIITCYHNYRGSIAQEILRLQPVPNICSPRRSENSSIVNSSDITLFPYAIYRYPRPWTQPEMFTANSLACLLPKIGGLFRRYLMDLHLGGASCAALIDGSTRQWAHGDAMNINSAPLRVICSTNKMS